MLNNTWVFLILTYIITSQHGFVTVFNDSSQAPMAYAGDLGMFRLFTMGSGALQLHADLQHLQGDSVVLYRTTESENGLKLGRIVKSDGQKSPGVVPKLETLDSAQQFHSVLHHTIELDAVIKRRSRWTQIGKEVGVMLQRYSDECRCAEDYADKPRYFVKPVADIHAVLYTRWTMLGLPILILHRLKVLLSGAGLVGGVMTLITSAAYGEPVNFYDLDLASRSTPRRPTFVWGSLLLFSVGAWAAQKVSVELVGLTLTTILGIFMFLYAGLHDVTIDAVLAAKDAVQDVFVARVGGPAYYGWPVHVDEAPGRVYDDALSWREAAQHDRPVVSTLVQLRCRLHRGLVALVALVVRRRPSLGPGGAPGGDAGVDNVATFRTLARKLAAKTSPRATTGGASIKASGDPVVARYSEDEVEAVSAALRCGLSGRLMVSPVLAADGYSYERGPAEEWFRSNRVSPVTGKVLPTRELFANNQLRNILSSIRLQTGKDRGNRAWSGQGGETAGGKGKAGRRKSQKTAKEGACGSPVLQGGEHEADKGETTLLSESKQEGGSGSERGRKPGAGLEGQYLGRSAEEFSELLSSVEGDLRSELKCPITMSRMTDAVNTCDGHTYERLSIVRWLRRHETSPKSNVLLASKALISNRSVALLAAVIKQDDDALTSC